MAYDTGMFHGRWTAIVVLGVLTLAGHAQAACKLVQIAVLPVTMVDMKPTVTAKINGEDATFTADSGAFFSMLSPASAAQLKLQTYPAPFGLRVTGIGGAADISVARVKVFTLAGVPIPNVEFLVGGGEAGGGTVGVLGQNVFRIGDVEYDLGKGIIRLMHEDDCGKANLAYWVAGTDARYSVMDIKWTTPQSPHTTGTALVNGTPIRVIFDTGASTSFLSVRAAQRAGIKLDAPGVVFAGLSHGIGREQVKSWIAPVVSFKIGDNEEIHNTHLRLSESLVDATDMLIGADFFLSHRVYVASKQHKLFFTYNGGPVFNLTLVAASAKPPAAAAGAAADPTSAGAGAAASPGAAAVAAGAGSGGAAVNDAATAAGPDGPKTAAEFSQRGTAFMARRDFEHAIADLTRACELAPEEPNYFYERGFAHWENKDAPAALLDFDQAIKLKPDHVAARVARAELHLHNGDTPRAIEDLNAADGAADKEADARLRMAMAYARAKLLAPAIAQLDLWIAAHAADARLAGALTERCWMRAVLGQDLSKALDDCNMALRRYDKKDVSSERTWSGRGLVRLRLGDYDKSIADYDAALKLRPKDAWALYGRGVDESRRGKSTEAEADMAAAVASWPGIANAFKEHGIAQ